MEKKYSTKFKKKVKKLKNSSLEMQNKK